MEDTHVQQAGPARQLISSSAHALTIFSTDAGDVVIRHRDAFDEVETLLVIPGDQAAQVALAIGDAAHRGARRPS